MVAGLSASLKIGPTKIRVFVSLPHTKRIQEIYHDSPFEVIYVNVRDNYGSFESTAKRLDLTGTLIYLDKEESMEILDYLKAEGIPHYVLIDKDGVIVEKDAPGPESNAITELLDQLLKLYSLEYVHQQNIEINKFCQQFCQHKKKNPLKSMLSEGLY